MYIFFLSSFFMGAKEVDLNALKQALKQAKHDTTRCRLLSLLAENASDTEWPAFNEQMLVLSEKGITTTDTSNPAYKIYLRYYAGAVGNKGLLMKMEGKINEALFFYEKSLKLQQELKDKKEAAVTLNNISVIYFNLGDMVKAFDFQTRSMKMSEEVGDRFSQANSLTNMATFYQAQHDLQKGLEYHQMALKIKEEIGDKQGLGYSYNNIGFIYYSAGDPAIKGSQKEALISGRKKALEYHMKSLKIREEIGDRQGISASYTNIGLVYLAMSQDQDSSITKEEKAEKSALALDYFNKSMIIQEQSGFTAEISWTLNYMAKVYFLRKEYGKALQYLKKALAQSQKTGYLKEMCNTASMLKDVYKEMGDDKAAFESFDLFIRLRDSLNSAENKKATVKSQLRYEYERKAAADSVRTLEEKKVITAQLQQEKTQRFALYGGLGLVGLFALFMVNRFRVTSKQKKLIEEQKRIVEEQKDIVDQKQKEILDSIRYAKRIQTALITNEKYIKQNLEKLNK